MIAAPFIHWAYTKMLKPVLFRMDPEFTHDLFVGIGRIIGSNPLTRGLTSLVFAYRNPMLEQEILGIRFTNSIGLAAGFDKNARLTKVMPCVGFGFMEAGSVTGEPCKGNPKKRLWRLPQSRGLVVNYGLVNDGAAAVCDRVRLSVSEHPNTRTPAFPIGISMARTNSKDCADDDKGIADYVKSFNACLDVGDYYTINVSCPNSYGGQYFHRPEALDRLLGALDRIETSKPVFLKLSPDTSYEDLDRIIFVVNKHRVHGFVISNLTKRFDNAAIERGELKGAEGGVSGKPVERFANDFISRMYKAAGGRYVIIGCGGVFSAEDAYEKIKRGASLVQLITGMIYEGPQLIGQINKDLVRLLKKDGYSNVSQAVGAAHRV
jgi:dihydroorotate dehydrogenase